MQIVDAIKNLTIAMKGSGSVEDITTDQIADVIQYMADNWDAISAGIGGGESHVLPAATESALGGVKKLHLLWLFRQQMQRLQDQHMIRRQLKVR